MKLYLKYVVVVFILIFQGYGFSQTNSSYSRIGIGDLQYSYSAPELGFDQIGASISSTSFIGLTNPATWYRLNMTRFQVGLAYSGLYLSDNSVKDFYGKAQFGGFTLAFPVSEEHGVSVAMGLVPYSALNYKVSEDNLNSSSSIDEYSILYQGGGGLSRVFIGSSYKLPMDFIFGASFNYYFGNLTYSSTAQFTSSNDVTTQYKTTYQPTGLGGDFGLLTPNLANIFKSKSITDLKAAVAFNYIAPLSTDTMLVSYSSIRTDTIAMSTVKMKIPLRISAGLSIMFSDKYLLSFDFASQAWSNYSFDNVKQGDLRNSLVLSTGFEFRPKRELGASNWEQTIWRAGLSYQQTQYMVYGIGINQFSISGGFSYPLSYANTVDFGVEYGIRGKTESNLIQEKFIKMNVGLSIGELWFLRSEK